MESTARIDPSMTLLRTMFYRPSLPNDFVARPHLTDRLARGLEQRLVLVCAPAGFGKSILVSSWLDSCAWPNAWLALDESTDNFGIFLSYLLGAIRTIAPGAAQRTGALLAGFELPPFEVLAGTLINDLDELEQEFILVLEDYHAIHEESIHRLITVLLREPLAQMHLVIISRHDPPLNLGIMRARNILTEVRLHDLRFSTQEATVFMERMLGLPIPAPVMAELVEKCEGWITGLRLAGLALRGHPDKDRPLRLLEGVEHSRYVADYLMTEVFEQVPARRRDFLIRTAILERMCAGVCDAVCGYHPQDAGGQTELSWLEQNDLFAASLDAESHWYRYHHLMRSFLLRQLERQHSTIEIAHLHSRASAWFADHGMLEDAIRHALKGSAPQAAVRLIAEDRHALMDTEQWQLHGRLLQMFPADMITSDPDLTLMTIWMTRLGWRDPAHLAELLDRADRLIATLAHQPDHARHLSGEVAALRALLLYETAAEPEQALAAAQYALAATPRAWYYVRSIAWLYLAVGYQMVGDLDNAYAAIDSGKAEDVTQDGAVHRRIAASRCFVDWMAGNLKAVPIEAAQIRSSGLYRQHLESLAWGNSLLCCVAYVQNNLEAAETYAKAVEELRYACRPMAYLQSAFVRISVFQTRGLPEQARQKLEGVISFLQETRHEGLLPLVYAFRADLAVRQGDLNTAHEWAKSHRAHVPLTAMPYFYAPSATLPKVLLALNGPDSHREAVEEIDRLLTFTTSIHNTYVTIQALALKALSECAEGRERRALETLSRAVALAEPGGIVRLFADLGSSMANLMNRLATRGSAPNHVGQILQAFLAERSNASSEVRAGLVEPLTRRERQILVLLSQRLTAGEIARELVISEQTVERHRANVYQKLGIHSRRDLEHAVEDFSLLP